jgi:hypothetical protein
MSRNRALVLLTVAAALVPTSITAASSASPATARTGTQLARSTELSASTRLADRRSVVVGDRFFEVGAEDGSYPAEGFHTRGEMGGFWTQPIKLLDGVWFNLDGSWLTARKYSNGWGYARMDLGSTNGVRVSRTDFAPDGLRAGLIGLTLSAGRSRTVTLSMDAHSELMKVYPWGETAPSQTDYNLRDSGAYAGGNLLFREAGKPPVANAEPHDYAAVVGSTLIPSGHALGAGFRGPVTSPVVCGASGPNTPPTPTRCDDTAYGRGTGGRLQYRVVVPAGGTTVWFAVAGSDRGVDEANAQQARALQHPAQLLAAKIAARKAIDAQTQVSLPGDRMLQRSVAWSKQNIADSVQQARGLSVRVTNAGTRYPAPAGTVDGIRWIGAGWPDYPWLFATDGEYTSFAAVASGQFTAIENHLRALRDVSLVANGNSGKVVHEVTPDGQVYFGATTDAGNTDETAKFPSIVALVWRWTGDNAFRDQMYGFAKSNLAYIYRELDADNDGWPEGLGNVERPGMGAEKLDNAVYTIRGLNDLADLAASKHDTVTQRWAGTRAANLERRFETAWWNGSGTDQYADSLADPGNTQVFQRHWIGVTPVEAELVRPGRPGRPIASQTHAAAVVAQREGPCYSGEFGLFHTGTGATTDPAGNPGPTCDNAVSSVASLRSVFTLNTSIMGVAEAALGRLGIDELQRYTTANARLQVDPAVTELPGGMPEIAPSPDFEANIDRKFTERSMALQAWGTYGVLWPVVHFELGVAPDLGRGSVQVVPQLPDGQHTVAGHNIRLGGGAVDVSASRSGNHLTTRVDRHGAVRLIIGTVLPKGTTALAATLNGRPVAFGVAPTARGNAILVNAGSGDSAQVLRVTLK